MTNEGVRHQASTMPLASSAYPIGPCTGVGEAAQRVHAASRRVFLRTSLVGMATGGLIGSGAGFLAPRSAWAQSAATPDAALQELMDGNQRYVDGRMTA